MTLILIAATLVGLFAFPDFRLGAAVPGTDPGIKKVRGPLRLAFLGLLLEMGLGIWGKNFGGGVDSLPASVHRWASIFLLWFFMRLMIETGKSAPALTRIARNIVGLAFAEAFLGMGLVASGLSEHSRISHTVVGSLLWLSVVWMILRTGGLRSCLKNPPPGASFQNPGS